MIAHSFDGAVFGPAQRLHGATFVVDAEFRRLALDEHGIVVDIGLASASLRSVLAELNYRNLDEDEAFIGRNTTTEILAREVFERLRDAIDRGTMGGSARSLHSLRVVLHESHVAWAAYEGTIGAASPQP